MQHKKAKGTHAKQKKIYLLLFTLVLLGGLFSWVKLTDRGFNLPSPLGLYVPLTKIGEIPHKRVAGSTVYLKGKVASLAPFLVSGAYELQDTTGSIWVVTNRTLPAIGEQVLIKGLVQYESIPVGDKNLGEFYIQEQVQL